MRIVFLPRNTPKTAQMKPLISLDTFRHDWAYLEMLSFLDEYLHTKNQRNWCITSRDIDDKRILKPDWTRAFWPIACTPEFSQTWDLHKKKGNYVFDYRLKKIYFGSTLGPRCPFWGKQEFVWKMHFCYLFVFKFLLLWRISGKFNEQIPKTWLLT